MDAAVIFFRGGSFALSATRERIDSSILSFAFWRAPILTQFTVITADPKRTEREFCTVVCIKIKGDEIITTTLFSRANFPRSSSYLVGWIVYDHLKIHMYSIGFCFFIITFSNVNQVTGFIRLYWSCTIQGLHDGIRESIWSFQRDIPRGNLISFGSYADSLKIHASDSLIGNLWPLLSKILSNILSVCPCMYFYTYNRSNFRGIFEGIIDSLAYVYHKISG